jgi:lysozyme
MNYSDKCLRLIKSTRVLYLDKTKLWNDHYYIGYSRLCGIGTSNLEVITKKEANALLKKDLNNISKQLNKHLTTTLNQHQFDSLVSLIYDIGIKRFITDEMFVLINKNKVVEASLCFSKFNKYMKKPIYRLIKTRKEEKNLWIKPIKEEKIDD